MLPPAVYMTDRVQVLLKEANNLLPEHHVQFQDMSGHAELLRRSAGAGITTQPDGSVVLYWDPKRINEYYIGHELMHCILHRKGWPQMFGLINGDTVAKQIADGIDNIHDHVVLNSRLVKEGFQVRAYFEHYVESLEKNSGPSPVGPSLLNAALCLVEALFFDSDLQTRALTAIREKFPDVEQLARGIKREMEPVTKLEKSAVRRSMINTLNLVDEWADSTAPSPQKLRERIGVSPLFTEFQLDQPATKQLEFVSYQAKINNTPSWMASLILRRDGSRCRTYSASGYTEEPQEISHIRGQYQSQALGLFLRQEDIKHGVI